MLVQGRRGIAVGMDCILLAGAPEVEQLDWNDDDLFHDFDTPIRRFLDQAGFEGTQGLNTTTLPSDSTPTASFPKWRGIAIPVPRQDDKMAEAVAPPQTQFLSFHNPDNEDGTQERLRFLELSLAMLSELQSSQIAGPEETTFMSTYSFATGTSFTTSNGETEYSSTSPTKFANDTNGLPMRGDVTDLKGIPSAEHITRIQPQTVTVNILAAIISISPSRTVSLRRSNREMAIVEIVLGDETRAGFSVSFWLAPRDSQHKQADDLRSSLQAWRSGDVVLIQNVALSAFKGCAFGQSLSRKFARNSTSVIVLSGDSSHKLPVPLQAKSDRVQGWADDFVGRTRKPSALRRGKDAERELPPDTQSPSKYG
ncbi:hypothetical protein LTR78_004105 [Recurvomyces mirabilis]|uniref:Uncharacterized protein n=1 Tax=Recurvomyces mirabilis TaxID=574656 RepID=A0AAE1C2R7_9PEZI|nr:hypothetical protein LTR78_004105 [Recurvomyces mirabilis]KAK5153722.1 hypothetical protein LTS14_007416 [Recurvomyces mirabilis]